MKGLLSDSDFQEAPLSDTEMEVPESLDQLLRGMLD